jgi:hypothetical protein
VRKILLVSLVALAMMALVSIVTFRRPANVTAQNPPSPSHKPFRVHERGIPADFGSDVPGVQLVALGVKPDESELGGSRELAVLRIINTTDRGIDAYLVGGGDDKDSYHEGQDAGFGGPDGYSLDPPAPLIPPHGQRDLDFALGELRDGWSLRLDAVKWHGGDYDGSPRGRKGLQGSREHSQQTRGRRGEEGGQ